MFFIGTSQTVTASFDLSSPSFSSIPSGTYYVADIPYRAPFGSAMMSFMLFAVVAGAVWGGLAKCLHLIFNVDEDAVEWNKEDPVGA